MTSLTPEDEKQIRTRRAHITDAPWGSRGHSDGNNTVQAGAYITLDEGFASSGDVAHIVADTPEQSYRRASFIARAPGDIDDLLNEIDRLRGELDASVSLGRDRLDVIDRLRAELAEVREDATTKIKEAALRVRTAHAEMVARPAEAHVLRQAASALEDDHPGAAAELLNMANQAEHAASDRYWKGESTRDDSTDNRRRIYLDGKGDAWISTCSEDGVEHVVHAIPAAELEQAIDEVQADTGSLTEIGRCW